MLCRPIERIQTRSHKLCFLTCSPSSTVYCTTIYASWFAKVDGMGVKYSAALKQRQLTPGTMPWAHCINGWLIIEVTVAPPIPIRRRVPGDITGSLGVRLCTGDVGPIIPRWSLRARCILIRTGFLSLQSLHLTSGFRHIRLYGHFLRDPLRKQPECELLNRNLRECDSQVKYALINRGKNSQ